jgi:hypothetical protein
MFIYLGYGKSCPFSRGSAYPAFCGELDELRLATAFVTLFKNERSTTLHVKAWRSSAIDVPVLLDFEKHYSQ